MPSAFRNFSSTSAVFFVRWPLFRDREYVNFSDDEARLGGMTYPFQMRIPEAIPQPKDNGIREPVVQAGL
jgi:hypothetical protein